MPALRLQIVELLLLAIPIASVAWTVTHEEVLREPSTAGGAAGNAPVGINASFSICSPANTASAITSRQSSW
jgi:hypothetical protein